MKSKEEIEQLAKEVHYQSQNQGLNADGCFNQYQGFIKGYTQCLKDIRKDWQNYTISEKSDFIEFLNKQD